MKAVCDVINGEVSKLLEGRDILTLKKNDDALRTFRTRKLENEQVSIGKNVVSAVS